MQVWFTLYQIKRSEEEIDNTKEKENNSRAGET